MLLKGSFFVCVNQYAKLGMQYSMYGTEILKTALKTKNNSMGSLLWLTICHFFFTFEG